MEVKMSGRKYDEDKPRMDLIAPEHLFALAMVLGYGAKKYADRNWEEGMNWSRVFAAMQRHLWKFWAGEEFDDESGLPHLAHAAFGIMVLTAYGERGAGTDDRPRGFLAPPVAESVYEVEPKSTEWYVEAWKAGGCAVCGAPKRDDLFYAHSKCFQKLSIEAQREMIDFLNNVNSDEDVDPIF